MGLPVRIWLKACFFVSPDVFVTLNLLRADRCSPAPEVTGYSSGGWDLRPQYLARSTETLPPVLGTWFVFVSRDPDHSSESIWT
ncbi:hypothetical protein M404DRAFT_991990 [Pisolithus tinctorius Marx 270]|uniref:Uncharacterized protein n=1 Tax=Pisolithus tinctorius Marx 270 TaxID=870435 RepID=A0A0C3K1G3_PISTI|nr:hypothetical protein M404DRAFT_991990 [Pisolithus tinctorius Marx 270]